MFRHLTNYVRLRARDASRFGRAQRGATAVEFALIAPAFLATLIAILQTSVVLFAQQNLQAAAVEAGRLFMTGQAQNGGMTEPQLVTAICPILTPLFNCNSLMVDVQSYTSFSGANAGQPTLSYNGQGQVTNTWSYNPGNPGQIMVVRLIYQWSTVGGPLGFTLANLPNGMSEMMGVTAFRVEPY